MTTEQKLQRVMSTMRVMLTWATFDPDGRSRGCELKPAHVEALIRQTLAEIGDTPTLTRDEMIDETMDRR